LNFEEYFQYQDERVKHLLGIDLSEKFNVSALLPSLKTPEIPKSPFITDDVFTQGLNPNLELTQALEPYKDLYDRYVRAFDQYESWVHPNPIPDSNLELSLHTGTDYFFQSPMYMENVFLDISTSAIDGALSAIRQALSVLDEEQIREYEDVFGAEDEDSEIFQQSEIPGKKRVRWPFLEKKQKQLIGLAHFLFNNDSLKKIIIKAGIGCATELFIQQIDSEPAKIVLTFVLNAVELLQDEIALYFKSIRNSNDEK